MRMKWAPFAIVLGLILSLAPAHLFAQTQAVDVTITPSPNDPKPFQQVTLTASSYGTDLSTARLSWSYDGTFIASGVGRTSVVVAAPASGKASIVTLNVTANDFAPTTATLIIRPSSIDMLWEAADSYTPPFFKGKALLPSNGLVRVVAVPSITAPKGITYTWKHNGIAMPESSGVNQTSILFANKSTNATEDVSVAATSGLFAGGSTISINTRAPSLVGYQVHDGFIDYANGFLTTATIAGSGALLRFEPYYFSSARSILNDLQYEFALDGTTVAGTPVANELPLTRPTNGGQSTLKVSILAAVYNLQQVIRTFTLNFN